MNMRPGRATCLPDFADFLPTLHMLARLHVEFRHMHEIADQAMTVVGLAGERSQPADAELDIRGVAANCTAVTPASDRRRLHGRALGMDILAVMSSSAATGVLGFAFWTAAARGYDAAEVGRASAIISSATLIAILANFSLGNLYERFLPLAGRDTHRLVRHGTTFALGAAVLFGVVFVLVGPRDELFPHPVEMALFPVAVAVLSVYALQDQVLVGLGRARMIATKNIGQSTTHSGRQPSSFRSRSRPTARRNAPSASQTTVARPAPKKIKSPVSAAVRSMMPATASSDRNLRIGDCRPSRPAAASATLT